MIFWWFVVTIWHTGLRGKIMAPAPRLITYCAPALAPALDKTFDYCGEWWVRCEWRGRGSGDTGPGLWQVRQCWGREAPRNTGIGVCNAHFTHCSLELQCPICCMSAILRKILATATVPQSFLLVRGPTFDPTWDLRKINHETIEDFTRMW